MAKFDKSGMKFQLTDVNDSMTGRKYVPYDKIVPNKLNADFSQEDIETLMYSITEHGLYHELVVVYDLQSDKFRIISGERRYRAIGMMREEDFKRWFAQGIPVTIRKVDSPEEEEIVLIEANIIQRNYGPEDRKKFILKLVQLYSKEKERGKISSVRQALMDNLNLSGRQAQTYMSASKVIPQLQKALISGQLEGAEIEKFASFTEESQHVIADMLMHKDGEKLTGKEKEILFENEKQSRQAAAQMKGLEKELAKKEKAVKALTKAEEKSSNPEKVSLALKAVAETQKEIEKTREKQKDIQVNLEQLRDRSIKQAEKNSISLEELQREKEMERAEELMDAIQNQIKSIQKAQSELDKVRNAILMDERLKSKFEDIQNLATKVMGSITQ